MIALQSALFHSGAELKTPGEEDRGMLVKTGRRETEKRGMSGGDRQREGEEEVLMIEKKGGEREREQRG